MRHVDEGALHAYLDGALDEYPTAEAHRVREHLETCAECAARLDQERRVREDAESILGLAAPRVEVPTFEELRAYVRAREPARTSVSVRLYRMGWAASVVLALGTGWLLRGEAPPSGLAPAVRERSNEIAPEAEATAAPAGAGLSDAVERAQADPSADSPPAAPQPLTRGSAVVAEPRRQLAERDARLPAPGGGAAGAPALADAADLDEVASKSVDASPDPTRAASAADPARVDNAADVVDFEDVAVRRETPEQRLTSAIAPAAPLEPLGALTGGRSTPADVPADDEATALVVPGLDVLDVLPVGQGTTFAGMRALQRLETGDTLEIVHLPEGVEPTSLPPLREGWRELLLPRGSGWLVLRAPVTEASLLELLQRLEAGR